MIELPLDFVPDLISSANTQIANFAPVLLVILGVSLSIMAIGSLIKFLK